MPTDYLYTRQSFFRGIASLGNLSGTVLRRHTSTPAEADIVATASDWAIVGNDIQKAINQHVKSIH